MFKVKHLCKKNSLSDFRCEGTPTNPNERCLKLELLEQRDLPAPIVTSPLVLTGQLQSQNSVLNSQPNNSLNSASLIANNTTGQLPGQSFAFNNLPNNNAISTLGNNIIANNTIFNQFSNVTQAVLFNMMQTLQFSSLQSPNTSNLPSFPSTSFPNTSNPQNFALNSSQPSILPLSAATVPISMAFGTIGPYLFTGSAVTIPAGTPNPVREAPPILLTLGPAAVLPRAPLYVTEDIALSGGGSPQNDYRQLPPDDGGADEAQTLIEVSTIYEQNIPSEQNLAVFTEAVALLT